MDCRVCGDEYEAPERRPRVLPCGHTVCHRCIILIIEDRQKLCPICRAPHRASCVHKFPLNYDLENVAHLMELANTSRLYSVTETAGRWQTAQVILKGGRLTILVNSENIEDQAEKTNDEASPSSNLQDFRLPMLLMEERLPERVFRMLSIDKGLLGCRRCLKLFSKNRRPCVLPCGDSVCNICQQNVTNTIENNKKSKLNVAQINYSLEDLTCQFEVVKDKLPWYNELYIIRESHSCHFEAALVGVSSARRLSHRRRWYFLHTLQDIMPPKDALTVHVSEDVLPSHLLWHVHLTCAALGRGTSISEVNTNTRLVQRPPPSTNSFMRRVLTSCVAFTTPATRTRNREELTRVD